LILIAVFCSDFRNLAAGGLPAPFPWPWFALGLVVGVSGLFRALRLERHGAVRLPS
jgi:hypothetical protein